MDGEAFVDKFSEAREAAYPDHWLKKNVSSVDAYKIFPEFNRSSVTMSVAKEDARSNGTANKQTNKMSSNTNDTRTTGFILIQADTTLATTDHANITKDDLNKTIAAIRQSNVTANISRERRSVEHGQARETRVHVARLDDDGGDHGSLHQYQYSNNNRNNRRAISSSVGHHL